MGKERIKELFVNNKKPCFISYITAGDPDYSECLEIINQLVVNGIDLLELGLPFSDPLADGEVNQLSAQRALNSGMTITNCLKMVKEVKNRYPNLPIILYSYLNLVAYSMSFEEFCAKASFAGVDGLLLLDLTPEESGEFKSIADNFNLGLVALAAPTTKNERLGLITGFATSFVYYVCREGVTGVRNEFAAGVKENVEQIRKYTELPVVVGFGISKQEHVISACESGVDGVVVGSAIVRKIQAYNDGEISIGEIGRFVKELTSAVVSG